MDRMVLVLLAVCVIPALATANYLGNGKPFTVRGRVYCDTCRFGFETSQSPGIAGARVRIDCKNKNSMQIEYSIGAVTDSNGEYSIIVSGDFGDDICDAVLVSSPQPDCNEAGPGRSRSRLTLTRYNGVVTDTCFANAMGYLRKEPMSDCAELFQKYKDPEDDSWNSRS
ncbi:hypothetical protein ACSBR2_009108 [Camellia fascicularis]